MPTPSQTSPVETILPNAPKGFLTVVEAAAALGVSRQAVIQRIERGTLPAVKQAAGGWRGWRWLIREGDISNGR